MIYLEAEITTLAKACSIPWYKKTGILHWRYTMCLPTVTVKTRPIWLFQQIDSVMLYVFQSGVLGFTQTLINDPASNLQLCIKQNLHETCQSLLWLYSAVENKFKLMHSALHLLCRSSDNSPQMVLCFYLLQKLKLHFLPTANSQV